MFIETADNGLVLIYGNSVTVVLKSSEEKVLGELIRGGIQNFTDGVKCKKVRMDIELSQMDENEKNR